MDEEYSMNTPRLKPFDLNSARQPVVTPLSENQNEKDRASGSGRWRGEARLGGRGVAKTPV